MRGDALAGDSGFGQTTARRLNILAALQDQSEPPEPYIIPDDVLTAATGVAASTLASGQSDSGAGGAISEAFTDEQIHWYGTRKWSQNTAIASSAIRKDTRRVFPACSRRGTR